MSNNKKGNKQYIGKVKQIQGQNGAFFKGLIDNPKPVKADNTPDPYYKGSLVWIDGKTGNKYLVKQVGFGGVSNQSSNAGFVYSLYIDYDDEYQVEPLA